VGISRRSFLRRTAGVVYVAGMLSGGSVLGANDRIRVACVGLHGRGRTHMDAFSTSPDSEVVALCDVDRRVLEQRAKELQSKTRKRVKTYSDIRDVLADSEVDVVSLATPNHWHPLGTIWACQAGKDVYVEKPLSHNIWEGRQLVAAAKKYNRIVQHGTQRRCERGWIRAIEHLREGAIGEVYMARGLCFKPRGSIGTSPDSMPPEWLDWILWQGPAEERPYNSLYVHYNWHWFWLYGNGDLGNQGVHQMDVAIWGMNKGLPVRVSSTGGRFGYKDQGETPNTQICTFTYRDGTVLSFEVRGLPTNSEQGTEIGNLFYGSEGYMVEQKFYDKKGKEIRLGKTTKERPREKNDDDPFANFLKAVRSRDAADLRAPVFDGHIASAHCHLGNIAFRVGHDLQFDPETERFVGDFSDVANQFLRREYRTGFEVPQLA